MPYPDRFGQVENYMVRPIRDAIDDEIFEPDHLEPSRMAVELTALIIERWRAREWFFEYTEPMTKEQFAAFKLEAQEEIDMWENELR